MDGRPPARAGGEDVVGAAGIAATASAVRGALAGAEVGAGPFTAVEPV